MASTEIKDKNTGDIYAAAPNLIKGPISRIRKQLETGKKPPIVNIRVGYVEIPVPEDGKGNAVGSEHDKFSTGTN